MPSGPDPAEWAPPCVVHARRWHRRWTAGVAAGLVVDGYLLGQGGVWAVLVGVPLTVFGIWMISSNAAAAVDDGAQAQHDHEWDERWGSG